MVVSGGSGFVWWCMGETKSRIEQVKRMREEVERMRKEKEKGVRVK